MTTLSLSEVDLLSQAVLTVNRSASFADFGATVFGAMRMMFGHDAAGINQLSPQHGTVIGMTDPVVEGLMTFEEFQASVDTFYQLPCVIDGRYLEPQQVHGFLDLMPVRSFVATDFYQVLFRRMDLLYDRAMVYQGCAGTPAWQLCVLRGKRSFSDQERLMLSVFSQHVRQRHEQMRATEAAHPLFSKDRAPRPHTWLLCDDNGRVLAHHPALPEWMRRLRVPLGPVLPEAWQAWLRQHLAPPGLAPPPAPLILGHGGFTALMHCVIDVNRQAHRLVLEARATGVAWLTPRERDVAHWLRSGKTNAEIAEILGVSQATVKNQVAAILEKLSAPNRTAAARILSEGMSAPP